MIDERAVFAALHDVLDPEMPVNIVDLGLIERIRLEPQTDGGDTRVSIEALPTFIGCPALDMIRTAICERVARLPGVAEVCVRFLHSPAWSTDRITPAGREALRQFGVTTPPATQPNSHAEVAALFGPRFTPLTVAGAMPQVACPYCGSANTHLESRFGPTRCKMIFYCDACRNTFEHLKPV
jgi:ring-1,2-phenylacetyl-CoA epoxidase subunit PaaD